jgi:hypothetical protein
MSPSRRMLTLLTSNRTGEHINVLVYVFPCPVVVCSPVSVTYARLYMPSLAINKVFPRFDASTLQVEQAEKSPRVRHPCPPYASAYAHASTATSEDRCICHA